MVRTKGERAVAKFAWQDPVIRFNGVSRSPASAVYDLLADLHSHLEWTGKGQAETTRLLTMEAPPGPAGVGTEFRSTGSDGKVARWTDRSVVTEAMRPQTFEFVTEGRRDGKPGSPQWLMTAVHRYEIAQEAGGARVVYTEHITRLSGAPRIMFNRVMSRLVFRMAAKYMRRGFDSLLALAEERTNQSGESADAGRRR